MSSLELPRTLSVASGPSGSVSAEESFSHGSHEGNDEGVSDGSYRISHYSGRQRPKIHDPARDLSIHVLEKFSLVTKFARETTSQLFRENNGFGAVERRHSHRSDFDYSHKVTNDVEKLPDEIPVPSDPLEVTICFLLAVLGHYILGNTSL